MLALDINVRQKLSQLLFRYYEDRGDKTIKVGEVYECFKTNQHMQNKFISGKMIK